MSARYTIPGPWTCIVSQHALGIGYVQIETGPLVDTRTNTRYEEGAHRVTVSKRPADAVKWPRGKTFRGEMAWCQAESYARDCVRLMEDYA